LGQLGHFKSGSSLITQIRLCLGVPFIVPVMMVSVVVVMIMIVPVMMVSMIMPVVVVMIMIVPVVVVSMIVVMIMMMRVLRPWSLLRIEVFVGFPRVFETGIALAGAQRREREKHCSQDYDQCQLLVQLELTALVISHLFGHFVLYFSFASDCGQSVVTCLLFFWLRCYRLACKSGGIDCFAQIKNKLVYIFNYKLYFAAFAYINF